MTKIDKLTSTEIKQNIGSIILNIDHRTNELDDSHNNDTHNHIEGDICCLPSICSMTSGNCDVNLDVKVDLAAKADSTKRCPLDCRKNKKS